ncbi:MAG: hypothetical protein H7293_02600 [Candidatus Saccharibacteria bacterium]|nr:hypothetical protein [Rhodoferax sp.]
MATTTKPTGNNATATPETVSEQLGYLTAKLAQLSALMAHAFGESGRAFRNMNDDLQDTYLWHCADVALDCNQAADDIHTQYLADCKAACKNGGAA